MVIPQEKNKYTASPLKSVIWSSACLEEQLLREMNANGLALFVSKYFKSACPSPFNSTSALAHTYCEVKH
jgi:hypothetical protein